MAMAKFTVETTTPSLDAAPAVNKGGGLVGLPATGHGLAAGDWVTLVGTTNYDQIDVGTGYRTEYELDATTSVNELVVAAAFVGETFGVAVATRKLFIAKAGVVEIDVAIDLYSDAKEHWVAGGLAMGFIFPFQPIGGNVIDAGAGSEIPLYAFLSDGWRIRPDEVDHTVEVVGGILLVQGGGDPFVDTLGAFTVRVNYKQPVQAITTVSSGVSQVTLDAIQATIDAMSPNVDHLVEMADGKYIIDPVTGKAFIYDDADQVYREAPAFEDALGTTPYSDSSEGIERRDRFVAPSP